MFRKNLFFIEKNLDFSKILYKYEKSKFYIIYENKFFRLYFFFYEKLKVEIFFSFRDEKNQIEIDFFILRLKKSNREAS